MTEADIKIEAMDILDTGSGACEIIFEGISSHKEWKRILTKLNTPGRQRRPRKCRRLNAFDDEIARLSSSMNVVRLIFKGNTGIGDRGMQLLHLIPRSVTDLDFSDCNLNCEGITMLCEWMIGNDHIRSLNIRGNELNDEACKAVGDMLGHNYYLRELVLDPRVGDGDEALVTWEAAVAICTGLHQNPDHNLRRLRFCVSDFSDVDEYIWYLVFSRLLPSESTLQVLEIASRTSFSSPYDTIFTLGRRIETVCGFWLKAAQRLQSIYRIDACVIKYFKSEEIQYYLDLNRYRARQLVSKQTLDDKVWFKALARANEEGALDVVYYFLQNKPHLCDFR